MQYLNRDWLIAEFVKEIIQAEARSRSGSGMIFNCNPNAIAGLAAQLADAALREMKKGDTRDGQLRSERTK